MTRPLSLGKKPDITDGNRACRPAAGHTGRVEMFTGWHTEADAVAALPAYLPPAAVQAVTEAIQFATRCHGPQTRPTGAPYLEHLLETLEVLVRGAGVRDVDILRAGVLHDVAEDTPCTLDEIRTAFCPRVAELVDWVTKPAARSGADRVRVKEEYLRGLASAPRDARLVKLADRVSNVQTLRNLAPARQRAYYAQTVRYVMPLAAGEPWFGQWYEQWKETFADLA